MKNTKPQQISDETKINVTLSKQMNYGEYKKLLQSNLKGWFVKSYQI
jgi:hypothetical protein